MNIEKGAPQGTPSHLRRQWSESSLIHWQMIHHGYDYNHFQCPCLLTGCMNLLCGFCLMGRPKREMQHKYARNIYIIIDILTESEIETYSLRLRRAPYAVMQTDGFPGRQGRISRPCRAELYGQCSISVRSFDYDGIAGR